MRRQIHVLFALVLLSLPVLGQKKIKVHHTASGREIISTAELLNDKNALTYFKGNYADTLLLMEELLKCRRNKEVNTTWAGYTSPKTYLPVVENPKPGTCPYQPYITNQLAALYLISALYYKDVKFCGQVIIKYYYQDGRRHYTTNLKKKTVGKGRDKYVLTDERLVRKAYRSYNKWYKQVKKDGLSTLRAKKMDPLKGSYMVWVR